MCEGILKLKNLYPWPATQVPPNEGPVWFRDEHIEVFKLFLDNNIKVAIELGSFLGRSTKKILELSPNAAVIAIDTWLGSQEHNDDYKHLLPTLYETFIANCADYKDRLIPVRETTLNGMKLIAGLNIRPDFIYVDADHAEDSVYNDVSTALLLFPSTRIVGDDFAWDSVKAAVARITALGYNIKLSTGGNIWWIE